MEKFVLAGLKQAGRRLAQAAIKLGQNAKANKKFVDIVSRENMLLPQGYTNGFKCRLALKFN